MKLTRSFLAIFLNFSLVTVSFLSLAIQSASAQDSNIALQRGYRTGYSDGYMSGYRDVIDNTARSFEKHSEYTKADRAYNKDYGSLEDYRDGYRQGFESGYDTGFEKRSFDATIPSDLKKGGSVAIKTTTETTITPVTETPTTQTVTTSTTVQTPVETTNNQQVSENTTTAPTTYQVDSNTNATNQPPVMVTRTENTITAPIYDSQSVVIPTDTELVVELLDDLNTDRSREGDKFTAKVISPYELSGAIIEGRISKIQKPGRIKRRAEMLLSFDRIVMMENRWSNFNAILTEVLPTKGDNVKRVDTEGTAVGKNSYKDDAIKVGAATGTGMVIGAVAGGPVGAAVGAGVGAAFGVGVVVVERGKHIKLNKNQQLRIKTVYETNIR
jgi:type IV secretion system protein VirB10